jgi:uncharacterized membrane protein
MRKSIEFVGLGFLVALYYITWSALTGPQRLPDRIPTHFDISGTPNAWGPPSTLWLLPIVGTALYVLITLIAHFPATFNYPVRVTPLSLPRIQDETKNMVSWIKAEIACLFTWIQWTIIQSARGSELRMSAWMIPIFMTVVIGTVCWHLVTIIRIAKSGRDSQGTV